MIHRRSFTAAVLVAALALAACGVRASDELATGDDVPVLPDPAARPESPAEPDAPSNPEHPAEPGAPAEDVVTGRVVAVDRDGPSVKVVESTIVTGSEATEAARAEGAIGDDEEWDAAVYVVEGDEYWVDIHPDAIVTVVDCTQACEHVAGTMEQLLSSEAHVQWAFVLDGGAVVEVDEIHLP